MNGLLSIYHLFRRFLGACKNCRWHGNRTTLTLRFASRSLAPKCFVPGEPQRFPLPFFFAKLLKNQTSTAAIKYFGCLACPFPNFPCKDFFPWPETTTLAPATILQTVQRQRTNEERKKPRRNILIKKYYIYYYEAVY